MMTCTAVVIFIIDIYCITYKSEQRNNWVKQIIYFNHHYTHLNHFNDLVLAIESIYNKIATISDYLIWEIGLVYMSTVQLLLDHVEIIFFLIICLT